MSRSSVSPPFESPVVKRLLDNVRKFKTNF